jgi:hypothetical protein
VKSRILQEVAKMFPFKNGNPATKPAGDFPAPSHDCETVIRDSRHAISRILGLSERLGGNCEGTGFSFECRLSHAGLHSAELRRRGEEEVHCFAHLCFVPPNVERLSSFFSAKFTSLPVKDDENSKLKQL